MFRFAPSPNGLLHRGHAYSALLNQRAAAHGGGRLLLRIEDIDAERCRPEFEAAIFEDLAWIGIRWEEQVMRQRERHDRYRAALSELDRLGLLYPAFASRSEIRAAVAAHESSGKPWPRDPDGAPLYPGAERNWSDARRRTEMASGRPFALRLDMIRGLERIPTLFWRERAGLGAESATLAADPSAWGDVILARREVPGSYHLSVVVDDADQSVTHVVRGRDLQPATSVHRLLQSLLGLPEPTYWHHSLILDETGRKLSKSRGSESLRALRLSGLSPEDVIINLLAQAEARNTMEPAPAQR